jgi:hypothetical protein
MISKVARAKASNRLSKMTAMAGGGASDNTYLINWRHYFGNTSTFTLFNNGQTTAFPYAYGSIPVTFDCYITSLTMTANKYSSYGTPAGTSATVYIYKGYNTLVTSKTLSYTGSEGMVLTFDFGTTAPINANEKFSIRWYSNGAWRYVNSTTLITER